jgi:hypothetical protein
MEEKKTNETVLELVKSFQETNQAMTASIVAAQERNMKLVQEVYQRAMEALQGQGDSTRTLMEELAQHARKQQERFQQMTSQEPFQKAAKESLDIYMNFLRTPLTYYQQVLQAVEATTRQGLEQLQRTSESFQKSTLQGGETVATTMQRTFEQAQEQGQSPPPETY